MKRLLLGAFFLLLLVLGMPLSISSEVNKGEKLYISHCSACHSLEGTGKGIFPSLIDIVDLIGKEGLFAIIKKGRKETGMPAIPSLSDQSLEDIYAYLKTLTKAKGERRRAKETEKESAEKSATTEEKSTKEKKKVLSINSLREMGISLTERAIKSYEIASRLPDLFSELPCFCGCQAITHSSLLDCFKTTHGAKCALCEEEAEVTERLYTAYRLNLNKLTASQEVTRSLDEMERFRKEEAEANKKIALTMVKLFWKRRAVGGCMSFDLANS
jgi:cytochrome c553